MQHEIDDKLAKALLSGDVRDGDTVMVGIAKDSDELSVSRFEDAPSTVE
jgi:ATP-dependent Clp protease ATP-binding subunit ClpB